jgi:hypothetical protein
VCIAVIKQQNAFAVFRNASLTGMFSYLGKERVEKQVHEDLLVVPGV